MAVSTRSTIPASPGLCNATVAEYGGNEARREVRDDGLFAAWREIVPAARPDANTVALAKTEGQAE